MRAVITDTPSAPALAAVKLIFKIGGTDRGKATCISNLKPKRK